MLSVVIVSYHSDEYLPDCLDSIFAFNDIGDSLQVILVDNARSLRTKSIAEKYEKVLYIESDNNGFGFANNVGTLNSKNDFLLFLNPDTVLIEPIFKFAVEQFLCNASLRSFGMILVNERGRYQESFGFFPEKMNLVPARFYVPLLQIGYVPSGIFPWGADLFVRKEDFMKAGMFDENIFMCYEEPDLIHRLPTGQIKIFPKKIIHKAGHSNDKIQRRYEVALQSEKYYFEKYGFNYLRYVKLHLFKIKIALFLKKLFFLKCDRERILLDLYYGVLS